MSLRYAHLPRTCAPFS